VVDILPNIDQQNLYNGYQRNKLYTSTVVNSATSTNNYLVGNTFLQILTCPEDDTIQATKGNLSYIINGGFTRWHGATTGSPGSNLSGPLPPMWDGTSLTTPASGMDWGSGVAKKSGVMFLGTRDANTPWDYHTTASAISDGASTTVLVSENLRAGYAPQGNVYSGGVEVNWATPHPNFMMFIASDNVCGGSGHSTPGSGSCVADTTLGPVLNANNGTITDGGGWVEANIVGKMENINVGLSLTEEGSGPYPSSRHPGGINVVMCDGSARFIPDSINGIVWSKIMTPAGQQIQCDTTGTTGCFRQLPLGEDAAIGAQ